jgi:hypothetical protein
VGLAYGKNSREVSNKESSGGDGKINAKRRTAMNISALEWPEQTCDCCLLARLPFIKKERIFFE